MFDGLARVWALFGSVSATQDDIPVPTDPGQPGRMFVQVHAATVRGVDALGVRVEVNLSSGLPSFTVVGLAQGSVREGRERVASALRNSGFGLPNRRITVNLAPADVRKAGTAFDLPIAVGILAAAGELPADALRDTGFVGELGLDGRLRSVSGVLSATLRFVADGVQRIMLPMANAGEARLVEGVDVWGAACLADVVAGLRGEMVPDAGDADPPHRRPRRGGTSSAGDCATEAQRLPDLGDVRGQEAAKRALEIAAGGGHNLLMTGPPGSGKTMLARRLPGLLPDLTRAEAIEVAKIHSVAGLLLDGQLPGGRPFRAPHHSVSYAGLHGGGSPVRPGEVSLAHHGVLFLDELPEFRRDALEMLRQPLEEGYVRLSRAGSSVRFPARVLLVASMNPCPCGYHGDGTDRCVCDPASTTRYRSRVSGPLLDRIDLHVSVPAVPVHRLTEDPHGCTSRVVAAKVQEARDRQLARLSELPQIFANAQLPSVKLRRLCAFTPEAEGLLLEAARRSSLSARSFDRICRVARTIADLEASGPLERPHVAEALQFRPAPSVRPRGAP